MANSTVSTPALASTDTILSYQAGHTYEVYNQGSFAQLLVEESINRTAVV